MISSIRHPFFENNIIEWEKWRIVFEGGELFRNRFLEKTSKREDALDFKLRKKMTPIPSFSKAAITEVKNSIFQRMVDVSRRDGPDSYQQAITGVDFGVDFKGSSMNNFIGQQVLPELLLMGRVGIMIDSPETTGTTLKDSQGLRPYLYSTTNNGGTTRPYHAISSKTEWGLGMGEKVRAAKGISLGDCYRLYYTRGSFKNGFTGSFDKLRTNGSNQYVRGELVEP